jgi:redox-sensing transcriptional repressor
VNTNHRSVSRLSRYRNALRRFKSYGLTWVYSDQIASALGITAAQVRKDFSQFGVSGKRKIGYHVDLIAERLDRILGKNNQNTAIIAGFGMLGQAFYKDYFSHEHSIRVVAAFDDDAAFDDVAAFDETAPRENHTGLPVYPFSRLIAFAMKNQIKFGIITLTDKTAQNALDCMALAGVQGILSLSPVELKGPKSCFINSVNLFREFENVVFFAGNNSRSREKRSAVHA